MQLRLWLGKPLLEKWRCFVVRWLLYSVLTMSSVCLEMVIVVGNGIRWKNGNFSSAWFCAGL